MIALNSYGEDYTGGLYVRAGDTGEGEGEGIGTSTAGAADEKQYVRLQAGDAVMHQYDLVV